MKFIRIPGALSRSASHQWPETPSVSDLKHTHERSVFSHLSPMDHADNDLKGLNRIGPGSDNAGLSLKRDRNMSRLPLVCQFINMFYLSYAYLHQSIQEYLFAGSKGLPKMLYIHAQVRVIPFCSCSTF